jgi:hypothetical protein
MSVVLLLLAHALQAQQFRVALKTVRNESISIYSRMLRSAPQLGASRQDFVGEAYRTCHLISPELSSYRTPFDLAIAYQQPIAGPFAAGNNS